MAKTGTGSGETLSQSIEDYLEAIFLIARELPVVRLKDISARLGVSMPSVNNAIKVLSAKGFVRAERYGYIELTETGRETGAGVFAHHTVLRLFFEDVLGLDHETAERDACRAEHCIGPDALDRIEALTAFMTKKAGDETPAETFARNRKRNAGRKPHAATRQTD